MFSLFQAPQIQQFREAFSLIDHDGDGVVSEQDLKHIFTSLGTCRKYIYHVWCVRPRIQSNNLIYSSLSPCTYASTFYIGIAPSKAMLDDLLADRPGDRRGSGIGGVHSRVASLEAESNDRGITFPMFLTMMGEHLYEFDAENELLEAFECFDENDTGLVKCDEIRRWLGDIGEKMDQREVRASLSCLLRTLH